MDFAAREVMGRTNVSTIPRAQVTGAHSNISPSQQSPRWAIRQDGRVLEMTDALLDSGADICILNNSLAAELGFRTSEVTDSTKTQATTAKNQVINITGQGEATIIINESTRVTTDIFTCQDIVPNLLFISRTVMIALGLFRQQDSVSTGHPH